MCRRDCGKVGNPRTSKLRLQGKTLVVRRHAQRFPSSIIRLINDRKRRIFLIVDHLGVYHAKRVKKWLQENKHRIEVYYLPYYIPELNPDVSTTRGRTSNRRARQ